MNISRRDFLKGSAASVLSVAVLGMGGIAASAEEKKDVEADEVIETPILIVGAGAAGMMAAYEVGKAGAKALVISNSPSASATNGAVVSGTCAVETSYTEEIGQTYSLDDLYKRMITFAHWTVNPRLLKNCVQLLPGNVEILDEMGVEMSLATYDRYGNLGFSEVHMLLTENKWALAEETCKNFGIEFMYNMTAEAPLMDGDTVVGIRATDKDGKVYDIKAKATLLACGGFIANKDKLAEHFGDIDIVNMGFPYNTGKGIDIALEAGGFFERITGLGLNDIYGMNAKASSISVFNANPFMQLAFYGNLITDEHGNRFMNEYMLANEPMSGGGEATLHCKRYYCIYDEKTLMRMKDEAYYQSIGSPSCWTSGAVMFPSPIADFDANLEAAIAEGWCYTADTLEEMAEVSGCEDIAETVKTYNGFVEAGEDTQFYKNPQLLQPIDENGPFYMFEYNPSAFNTFGGCRTDHLTRALKSNYDVIPGLYIAGTENGSLYSSPYYDVGGTCNGLSLASGRLAGMEMVKYVQE
ncbi:MAG: FAD-binding protein [Oscillospiraceae bacterium]|nr:FAD-binding protein [Oscillospiraceae bacterium]